MIKIHSIVKTNIGEDWDIELIGTPDIHQATQELATQIKQSGYLVSLFYLQSVLKIQFFEKPINRSVISIPKNAFEHKLRAQD